MDFRLPKVEALLGLAPFLEPAASASSGDIEIELDCRRTQELNLRLGTLAVAAALDLRLPTE